MTEYTMIKRLLLSVLMVFATLTSLNAQTSYEYDNLYRLTKVTYSNGTSVSYTYDALGNRTSKKVIGAEDPSEAYVWLSSNGKTLTFCNDNKRSERTGQTYNLNSGSSEPDWNSDPWNNPSSVTSVVFQSSFANVRPTSTFSWFCNFKNLTSISGLNYLNTSEVTNMYSMFRDCSKLNSLDVSHFDTSNVTMLWAMFDGCSSLKSLDVSHFDTSKATDFTLLFAYCSSLENLDVSNFNTSNVTNMYMLFVGCGNLKSIDVSNFDTSKVYDFSYMFSGCTGLTNLDVSGFNISAAQYSTCMFQSCVGLKTLSVSASMSNINDNACYGIGSSSSRCAIFAPDDFNFGTDASGGTFEWKQGYFKSGRFMPGDLNNDAQRDKADLELLVKAILGNKQPTKGTDLNNDGRLTVADVTLLIESIKIGYWPIVNNGHEYVNLGLPSGTLWATCNVGATKPEEYGGYYAWGETDTKDNYSVSTYNYWNSQFNTGDNLGDDIRGTIYDVAHVKWGGDWQMPSLIQIQELKDNCSHESATVNGVKGMKFVGPNGNSIFLPFAGLRIGTDIYSQGTFGVYRTGIPSTNLGTLTYYLSVDSDGNVYWDKYGEGRFYRYNGMTVRPVVPSPNDDSGISPDDQQGGPGVEGGPITDIPSTPGGGLD